MASSHLQGRAMLNIVHRSLHYLAPTCSFILTSCHSSPRTWSSGSLHMTQCPCWCYTLWLECPSYFLGLANSTQYLGIQLKNILLETFWTPYFKCLLCAHISWASLLALTILKFSVPVYMCLSPPLPLPTLTIGSLWGPMMPSLLSGSTFDGMSFEFHWL